MTLASPLPTPIARPTETRLVGCSAAMRAVQERIRAFGPSSASVLIHGESGTGKEVVARMLHEHSLRPAGPFVAINCAALPEALIESELFGHARGAFTGAATTRIGRFAAAHGGTFFLDEVGELPLAAQAKLLRALENREVSPVGADQPRSVDVRVVAATHRDLRRMVQEGGFREDLYYRLNVLRLALPALRERRSDLMRLVLHFCSSIYGRDVGIDGLTSEAWKRLEAYPFPGNIRELRHALEHAHLLANDGRIDAPHLPEEIRNYGRSSCVLTPSSFAPLAHALQLAEREHILAALKLTRDSRLRAAELLHISRKSLWKKMREFGITPPVRRP